jgi:hypothetical protein
MTRDMDLVRKILLAMAAGPGGYAPEPLEIEGYDQDTIQHHAYLMEQAGLITAVEATAQQSPSPVAIPLSITWEGHEFLEKARDPTIWVRGLTLAKKAGSVSFPILTKALTDVALDKLKTLMP